MRQKHHDRPARGVWLIQTRALTISVIVALLAMFVLPLATIAATPTPVTVTLSPSTQVAVVGDMAKLTATVKLGDTPKIGVTVQFDITGTNPTTKTAVTNSQGQASITYTGSNAGTDTATATASSVTSSEATIDWIETSATNIAISPSTLTAAVNSTQTFTVTVTDQNDNPVSGVPIVYTVTGQNPVSATDAGTTNNNGQVTFSYKGTTAGSDTVTAFTDFNGNTTLDTGEISAKASVTWGAPTNIALSPTSVTRYTGNPLTLTATVTDQNDNPVQGVTVTFTISGPNSNSGTAATDANGKATFTDPGTNAGIDTVHALVQGIAQPASATIQWIPGPATLTLSASNTSPTVNSQVTVTATLKDHSGNAVPNVKILFTVSGANTSNGSDTTGNNGQATFSYTGTKTGQDTVTAFADLNGNGTKDTGEPTQTLTITWMAGAAPSLSLTPSTQSQHVGTTATLTAQLTNPGGSASGIKIYFTVTGANSTSKTVTTDANGKATFSYNGSNTGTDTVKAWADLNGNGSKDTGEPNATATVVWTSAPGFQPALPASPKPGCTYFPQTQHNLCAGFAAYWNNFGGLPIFSFPLTEEFQENGVTVQYFERARFEWHPGAWPSHYDVLLGLLGNEVTAGRGNEAPFKTAPAKSSANCTYYAETGHNLCAGFRAYWNNFGGLAIYGFPISEEFQEKNPDTGQVYTVQYFQRARFEWHPGEAPARFDVELGRLGAQVLYMRYGVMDY